MSLIKCPECGKEISDKSNVCIHCGYPIKDNSEKQILYAMVFKSLNKNANIFLIKSILEQSFGINKGQAYGLLQQENSVLIDGIKEDNINFLRDTFNSYGCNVDFIPSNNIMPNHQNEKWEQIEQKQNAPIICPRCGSNQITTGQRGFSLLTGFIGSNKTVNRCGKCGYSWKP